MITRFLLLLFTLPAFLLPQETVIRVPVQGTIDLGLPPFIERVMEEAERTNPAAIIFDIDTFGGRIDGATRIKDAIMAAPVPTIAFINRRAISAGALIALSCDSISMTSGATIGAATAVDLEGKKASEKVISYMREEMSASAEARGRSREIAEAMVDEELELLFVVIAGDTVHLDDVEGSRAGKLITLTTEKALRLGIADHQDETFEALLQRIGLADAEVVEFRPSWSERIVRFLTDPIVSSLLMTIGFLGLIFEIKSPGFGVGGIIGLIALSLFFGTSIIAQLANYTELLIFLVGVGLLLLEAVVIPGFGIAGISGIGLMLWGFYSMLIGEFPTPHELERAFVGLNIGVAGGIVGAILLLRLLIGSRFFKKNVPITGENYSVGLGLEVLIGHQGITLTECMPSGKGVVGDQQLNISSRGEHIARGVAFEVMSIEGNTAFIRAVDSPNKE